MRGALAVVMAIGAVAGRAAAGPMDHPEPPALSDEADDLPSPAQAMTAARGFLRAVAGKRPEKIAATLAIPFVDYLAGGTHADDVAYCFDAERYTDEAEGLPGAPDYTATGNLMNGWCW